MDQNWQSFTADKQDISHDLFRDLLKERAGKQLPFLTPKANVELPVSAQEKILEEEGKDQQSLNQATKKELDIQTLDNLVRKSNRIIFRLSNKIFPWDFFPTTIIIEESRVTFVFCQFLASQSHSVDIKDISNVFIESSFFLASLQVVSRTYIQNDIKIGNLNREKAEKARRIIEGLRTFLSNNIDTSNYEIEELINKLEELHTNR